MGGYDQRSVSDFSREMSRKQVYEHLYCEIKADQKTQLSGGYGILILEDQEQKRGQVVDDGLGNITGVAGIESVFPGIFHKSSFSVRETG